MANKNIVEIKVTNLGVDKFNVRGSEWVSDEELIDSIRKQGVLEPLLVRKTEKAGRYSIVCGTRRWNAAQEAGLRVVPCIVRKLNDLETISISFQENIHRNNLNAVQMTETVAKMWDMLNGSRNYEEKIAAVGKMTSLAETSIRNYLAISRLSEKIKDMIKPSTAAGCGKLDTSTAAYISTSDWSNTEKEQAAKILSRIEVPAKRRKIISKMKSYKDLSPAEAYKKVQKQRVDRKYIIFIKGSIVGQFDNALTDLDISATELIERAIEEFLKKRKYL